MEDVVIGMRVLVTGNAGYIGPIVTRQLLDAGHEVTGFDSGLFDLEPVGSASPEVTQIVKDIRDVDCSDVAGHDAIIHLAALSNDPLGELNPGVTEAVNHEATLSLAKIAKDAGVARFVFAGSCSAYGAGEPGEWLDESAPLRPQTAYARSKVEAENELVGMNCADFTTVLLRSATAYGAAPILRTDLVVNELVARALIDGRVVLRTSGVQWRPLVHVEDIARAAVASLGAPHDDVGGRPFNVGSNHENYRVRDIADVVADSVPGAKVIVAGDAEPDRRDYRVSFDRFEEVLPHATPQWTLARGIAQLVEVFSSVGVSDAVIDRYSRVKHLKRLTEEGGLDESVRLIEQTAHA
ncbi:MAG: SDR family oxidoreductase [Acidimicrobiia bacterium]|nr:SDR family oxidoreductase [Acidimicrobiia bacterium]